MRIMLDVGAFQREENRNGECAGKRRFETLTTFFFYAARMLFFRFETIARGWNKSRRKLYAKTRDSK